MATKLIDLPAALEAAGVNVRTLDGWEKPHYSGTYLWREADGEPAGSMAHHTASSAYTPNRDKANGYAGLSFRGSDRLYQERYEGDGYAAVYTIANAYPAPISSGAGDKGVLVKVRAGIEVRGRQGPDTSGWYGNTHYHNDEWILNGIGAPVDQEVWEMMVVVCQVKNELMGWTPFNHICHGHHTRRKVDLWDGSKSDTNRDGFDLTMVALRQDMGGDFIPPIIPPEDEMLKSGDTGTNVQKWQNYLNRWAEEYQPHLDPLVEDGSFGSRTETRTIEFQNFSAIANTGMAGYFDLGTMAVAIGPDTGESI